MAKMLSTKRVLISQANSRVVLAAGAAAFIFVFCMVATKTLISQAAYQNKVISAKKVAVKQLKDDVNSTDSLRKSYSSFINTSQNVIDGDPGGSGAKDGDNTKIILDALPSSYDFPALATTLDKLIISQGLTIESITGTDDEVAQSSNTISGTPKPVAMPFEISVSGDYASIQKLIDQFEHSTRPFQFQTFELSNEQNKLKLDITAQTFYQPAKTFKIGSRVVK